ncbi:dynein axonemal heavy chain 9-like [Amia ocellicauda]|uniref:dynein axonemal heavy chain 9-like n=1 Tax=Amia ocellicauda TaxID=2972642 RepID=UPI0034644D96
MLSLCIQLKTEGAIEEEELSFLLKGCRCYPGHPLSLGDFGCDAEPPAWIPPNQWESVLSLSLFPGPLDGVCVQIVEHSSEWEIWFRLDCPERERLPLEEAMVRDNTAPGGSEGQILDIHRLLVLRALRPDRLATALPVYMLEQGNAGTINPRLTDVKCLEEDWVGILVLLPVGLSQDNGPSNEHLVMSVQPAAVIRSAAQGRDISVSVVSVREDCQSFIDEALGDMTECGGWLVIENVHLAPVSLLKKIQDKVNLAKNMAGEQTSRKPFKVWLLAELGTPFPEDFLSELHKVSWHVLLIHHLRRESEASDLLCGEQGGLLPMAVVSALEQVEKQVWVEVRDLPVWSRQICFNACVLHGLIVGSQFLPGSGLSRLYPVTNAQLQQAMDAVISSGAGLYAPSESFIKALIEEISDMYTSAVTDPEDALYIRGLAREVLLQSLQPQGEIAIGEFVMPVPAADTDCALYSSWLCKNLPEFGHCSALALHKSTRKLQHQSSVAGLLRNLSVVYEALQCGLPSSDHEDSPAPPGTAALRLALDLVLEQLPGLLEIGAHFQKPRSASQRPSGLGSDQMENTDSMDAVGHALLQECDWMNTLLCHIGQQVTALSGCTLMDGGVLPAHLAEASSALRRRRVPRSWMHPHCRPATSSLQAWMEDLKTKHGQLKRWVDDTVSSVWLGGLANPAALVLSLRQAFAAAHACLPDEMVLRCDVAQTAPPDLQPHHLILEGLCLQGASWDFSSSMLEESSEEFFPLPYVILRPVLLTAAARAEQTELFECPVYMNSMRQCCLLKLPLRSGKSEQYWRLKKAAVILDIKPPVCFPSQSKGYWAAKRIQNRPPPRGPLRTEAFTSPVGIASRVVSNQPAEQGGVPLPSQAENPKAFAEFQGSASGGGPSDQLPPLEGRPPPTSAGPQNPPWAQDPKIFPHVTAEESPTELPRDWSQKSEEDAGVQPILREAMSEDNKVTEEDVPTQLAERDPGAEDGFQRAEGGYLHLDSSS